MLLIIHLAFVALFLVLGVVLMKGKGAFLIAGYNTASEQEKNRTDEKRLCRFMGKLMFTLAGCWLVIASSEVFGTTVLLWIGLGAFLAVTVGAVIYANTGNRFQK